MMYINYDRKLQLNNPTIWKHHRSGWAYVIDGIKKYLHDPNGILFIGYLDGYFLQNPPITESWIGVLHNTPIHPPIIKQQYPNAHDLQSFFQSSQWLKSQNYCKGLITLSKYTKSYIESLNLNIKTINLIHPTGPSTIQFSYDNYIINESKKLLSIGHWMRNYEYFYKIRSPNHSKILIKPFKSQQIFTPPSDIQIIERLENNTYDQWLSENLVFLNLYDSSVNNVILECIKRGTPILVNKLDPIIEYLGINYPYYYTTIDEIPNKLLDQSLILQTNHYLRNLNIKLNIEDFIVTLINSHLYQKL